MTSPKDAVSAVTRAIANSGELSSELSVLFQEADLTYEDADVDLPVLEIQISESSEVNLHNTDFIGYVTDSSGNQIGEVYASEYELMLEMALWTTKDGGYDPDILGRNLRDALYPYSSYGPAQQLTDSDGNEISDITYFRIGDGGREDDLLQTPSVRKWTQEVELWGCEQFRTDKEYIVSVNSPASGDFTDTNGDGMIDNSSPDKDV